jgi:ribosomal protein S18 acetylase RimI-like enzyme
VPVPHQVLRFWRALDERVAQVEPTRWGAVVTDGRFPGIWDTNYARVDRAVDDLTTAEIATVLAPALRAVGAEVFHVVMFDPEGATELLAELSALGHAVSWDAAMEAAAEPTVAPEARVEELSAGPRLWRRIQDSMGLFGVADAPTIAQLRRLETEVLTTAGKRWFGVRDGGRILSMAALIQLDGVGYVDNVATFPEARGKGLATAVTAAIVAEARRSGAGTVFLLVDPEDVAVVRMYERLGFRETGRIASTKGPIPTS